MGNSLDQHHVDLICRMLQAQLAVTFTNYGREAGSQIEIVATHS